MKKKQKLEVADGDETSSSSTKAANELKSELHENVVEEKVAKESTTTKGLADKVAAESDKDVSSIDTSSIEQIIQSFSALDFMTLGAREVPPLDSDAVTLMFLSNDEYIFTETERLPMYFKTWFDVPNRKYYVYRNEEHFLKWNDLDGYFAARLQLESRRMEQSLIVLREPPKMTLSDTRVCDPACLGYPIEGLLDGTTNDTFYRNMLKMMCCPRSVNASLVKLIALCDVGVAGTNERLVEYSRRVMPLERQKRNSFLSQIAVLEGVEKQVLVDVASFEQYYPSFTPFHFQGVLDNHSKESVFRIQMSQPIVMPNVRYVPMAANHMMKTAGISITRASFVSDVINRSWKAEFGPLLWTYVLSLLMPGEIFFNVVFPDSYDDIPTKGFIALIMRLMLMYDEKSILCNSTSETQQSIDRAIIAWGEQLRILERISVGRMSVYPLNDFKLVKANAKSVSDFDFLKVSNQEAGMCANGCAFVKVDDPLRAFYPNIVARRNYAVDLEDYQDLRDSTSHLSAWRVYQGALAFLSSSASLSQYRSLFMLYGKTVLEFLIRVNEYTKINWYNIFRMTSTRAASFIGTAAASVSPVVEAPYEFFVVIAKGLDSSALKSRMSALDRMRYQGSFVKESFRVYRRFKLIEELWNDCGALISFPSRQRIKIACQDSPFYNWLRSEMNSANQDKLLPRMLDNFKFNNDALAECFLPLNGFSNDMYKMYGILRSVLVRSTLNFITRKQIVQAIGDKKPLTNAIDIKIVNEFSYRDIETFLKERRFNSTFYESSESPFRLRLVFPYTIQHELLNSANVQVIRKSDLNREIAFSSRIAVVPVKLLFLIVDQRDYQVEDDYVLDTHRVDEIFPESQDVSDAVVEAGSFYANIGSRGREIIALTTKDYKFVSLYTRFVASPKVQN
uniref:Uncharacterized protein n=1 Tax=Hubei odonate virus 15 TaxID=1922996 RepID=A0A1L3KP29_9VIRU|nr:hypothetical protein 2 [Hubei odonate virus 15]